MSKDFGTLLTTFQRHLEVERNLSVHTVRAYMGDLSSLLEHLENSGLADISQLQLVHLRSWLANQQVKVHLAQQFHAEQSQCAYLLSGP